MRFFVSAVSMLALCAALSCSVQAQVFINEVMANNNRAVQNEGIYPDWVELLNTNATAIDIGDWSISDSINTPRKYIFPAGTTIPANGYLMVWCDNLTNAPGLHTGFTLSGTTDDVSIYKSISLGGVRQDRIDWGLQIPDLSISRVPDGPAGTWSLTPPTPGTTNAAAVPLGPTNTLRINEVMANPAGGEDWFELYNPETNYVHIGGLVWSDRLTIPATNKAIAALSFIAPGGFIQFIADDRDADADHVSFKLGNSGDNLTLFSADRTTWIDRIIYTGSQTNGVSFGLLPDGSTNRVFFAPGRSTPGASNFQLLTDIVINEVLTHSDPPLEDAIELYNPTTNTVDISGWWLSNSRDDPKKFRIPAGTTVAPGGYIVFYENPGTAIGFNSNGFGTNRSFTLNSARGDQVYLHTADASGNLTFFRASRDFGPAENSVSFGRYVTSDGQNDLVAMSRRSFGVDNPMSLGQFRMGTGLTNPYPRIGPLVINEIMYHPPDIDQVTNTVDNGVDEYIEIHNPGTTNVLLYDPTIYRTSGNVIYGNGFTNTWRLRGVVDFNFPTNISLGPSGYLLVVNFNPATNTTQLDAFRAKYGVPTNVQMFGPYSSKLDNGGGTIDLLKPDPPQSPEFHPEDAGLVPYVRVEKVEYNDVLPWPIEPDGSGAALQRVHALGYGNDPTNWVAVAPSPGAIFIPNTPPMISPVADMVTNEMRRIQFFVTATDTNVPSQALTFSLDPGAPLGARIEASGLFRWAPREEHGPGSYPITVRVTDNGTPRESSTETFTITVNEVNRPPYFRIRDAWVKAGTTVSFMTGFDVDLPPQLVTYEIEGPAPEGVTIDSNTGEVRWTPSEAQAATNLYYLTVKAYDDGEPATILTNRFTYNIHVLPSTATLIVADWYALPSGDIVIEWDATVGKTYLIQATDDLTSPNWVEASDFLFAGTTRMSWSEQRFRERRFYRVYQTD